MGLPKGIQKLTSTGMTVTITDPTGPVTNLEASGGGGLPAWFQSGSGSPVGSVTPNTVGGLYFDTSGATGLWTAIAGTSADWAQLGGLGDTGPGFDLTGGEPSLISEPGQR